MADEQSASWWRFGRKDVFLMLLMLVRSTIGRNDGGRRSEDYVREELGVVSIEVV